MKKQKLGLSDFESIGTEELLSVKGGLNNHSLTMIKQAENYFRFVASSSGETSGGGGGGGGCAGDANGFGGVFDADEVVIYGSSSGGPMIRESTGSWQYEYCPTCNNLDTYDTRHRNAVQKGVGTWLLNQGHNSGCGGGSNKDLRHHIFVPN